MKKQLLITFILLSACTVGPDYSTPKLFNDEELQKSVGLDDIEKVNAKNTFSPYDFGDATLNNFMDEVQEDSPSIKIAILKLKQARENLNITLKNGFPTLDFIGKYTKVNNSKNMGNLLNSNFYEVGLDMNWEIDIFGGTRRKTEVSKAQFMAEIYNLKNVNVSLVSEVATIYVNLRNAEQQLKNALENLAIQEEAYDIVLEKYNVALTDEISVSQAKYLLETTKMQIPEYEYQREVYANSLAVILGKLPGEIDDVLYENKKNIVSDVFAFDLAKLYELPISVIRNRPDVKVAEENLVAQNAEIGVALGELYPTFSLSGFLGFESKPWRKLINSDSSASSIIPSITFPIFHWGQLRRNVRIQKLLTEESLENYKNTVLTAVSEVRNAIVAVEKEYQINKSAREAYESMSLVSELNWKKYELGLIDYTQVLESEQNRLSAQTNWVNSNANLYKYLITFYKAIGGRPVNINSDEKIKG